MEFTKAESEAFYARKDGLTLEDRDYAFLSSATGDKITEATGSGDAYALLSYFGKFNYSYLKQVYHNAFLKEFQLIY